MPLIIQEHTLDHTSKNYFARVLSDQPTLLNSLGEPSDEQIAIEAIFNGQPVALLLAERAVPGCKGTALVVHPATRGRLVGRELLQKGSKLLPTPIAWDEPLRTLADKFL